jgi:hypothetical protein
MPEGADPMDVRYNVIQWVHRSTRGWSYGSSVTDPRAGEIIKGHVTLGSLRVRQDYLMAEAFLAPYAPGAANPMMERMALARLRQLSAHEVGHTLGLGHNYIASTRNRASVMDYPHPRITLDAAGKPDFSDGYASGIGEGDKVSIEHGYRIFTANEREELNALLNRAAGRGLVYLTDQDARPLGSAHPEVHLWDEGADAVAELNRLLAVRAKALERFEQNNIRPGTALARLEDVLVPLYLGHRYQLEAAAKVIGGLSYSYALRGDGQTPTALVAPARQRAALEAVLATLQPRVLALPERLLRLIPPRPSGVSQTRELFRGRTGVTFDPLAAAESAAHLAAGLLLHAERANRLVEHHARDAAQPALEEVLGHVLNATWKAPRAAGLEAEVRRTADLVVLQHLMALAVDGSSSGQTRAVAWAELARLKSWCAAQAAAASPAQSAHLRAAARQIEQFEKEPKEPALPRPLEPPPGRPIGGEAACDW